MPEDVFSPVTLETLAGGAALELFDREFAKLLENAQDPNTKPDAKRSITLKVTLDCSEDRESAVAGIEIKSSLAPAKPAVGRLYMGRKDGRLVAITNDPRQRDFFREDGTVLPLDRRAARD